MKKLFFFLLLFVLILMIDVKADSFDSANFSINGTNRDDPFDSANFTIGVGGPTDTCTYSSGNWNVECSDNCTISSNVDLSGNDINISGEGIFVMNANVSNFGDITLKGINHTNRCEVYCQGGCFG